VRRYCTLFDSAYAVKGVLMIESLFAKSSTPCDVRVLALDEEAERAVGTRFAVHDGREGRHWVSAYRLSDLEAKRPELRACRAGREWRHYCWQLASCWTRENVPATPGEGVAYLDADLWFFADPEECWREAEGKSAAVVPHRFPPKYAHYSVNGKFCQCATFFLDERGFAVLRRWAGQCVERCDDSTCGDQRYLDSWRSELRDRLHVFRSKGIVPGPWNAWTYRIEERDGRILVDDDILVAYHYHEHARDSRLPSGFRRSKGYPTTPDLIALVYEPYERAWLETESGAEFHVSET